MLRIILNKERGGYPAIHFPRRGPGGRTLWNYPPPQAEALGFLDIIRVGIYTCI